MSLLSIPECIASEQVARWVIQIMHIKETSCKDAKCKKILQDACRILLAQDEIYFLEESFHDQYTQTDPCLTEAPDFPLKAKIELNELQNPHEIILNSKTASPYTLQIKEVNEKEFPNVPEDSLNCSSETVFIKRKISHKVKNAQVKKLHLKKVLKCNNCVICKRGFSTTVHLHKYQRNVFSRIYRYYHKFIKKYLTTFAKNAGKSSVKSKYVKENKKKFFSLKEATTDFQNRTKPNFTVSENNENTNIAKISVSVTQLKDIGENKDSCGEKVPFEHKKLEGNIGQHSLWTVEEIRPHILKAKEPIPQKIKIEESSLHKLKTEEITPHSLKTKELCLHSMKTEEMSHYLKANKVNNSFNIKNLTTQHFHSNSQDQAGTLATISSGGKKEPTVQRTRMNFSFYSQQQIKSTTYDSCGIKKQQNIVCGRYSPYQRKPNLDYPFWFSEPKPWELILNAEAWDFNVLRSYFRNQPRSPNFPSRHLCLQSSQNFPCHNRTFYNTQQWWKPNFPSRRPCLQSWQNFPCRNRTFYNTQQWWKPVLPSHQFH